MTDEMKEASLRQGSDNTRKGLGISRVAFVMPLQAYVWKEINFALILLPSFNPRLGHTSDHNPSN